MTVRTPTILLRLELILSALAAASAVGFAIVALQGQNYFMLAGEALILVAGIFGVFAGLGRFAMGPAMAASCVGGSIAVGAGVGGLETAVLPSFRGEQIHTLATLSRVGIAGLLGLLAGLMILSRTPGPSIKRLVIGALAVAPVAALGVAWQTGAVAAFRGAVPTVAFQVSALAAGLVAIVLLSVAAHCVIRAFEIGVDAADPQTPDPVADSAAKTPAQKPAPAAS